MGDGSGFQLLGSSSAFVPGPLAQAGIMGASGAECWVDALPSNGILGTLIEVLERI